MKVYEHFDAATGRISAYAVLYDGVCIGRVVFKDGTACRCFAQVWGTAMGEGSAGGGGYDRHTGAFEAATAKADQSKNDEPKALEHLKRWKKLAKGSDGERWDNRLIGAGYVVQHVI